MDIRELRLFYTNKRVLVTGHTGFKGAWLCKILSMFGAEVHGYALDPPTNPSLYGLLELDRNLYSTIADIRDYEKLRQVVNDVHPDYIFHLAAQPIVRESYRSPRETYEINVMGTVNLLECIRCTPGIQGVINVTTDKVYENDDTPNHAFRENEKLDGYDPYSNSKSCSELVTHAYKKSFFHQSNNIAISTIRAGNVIGGGDFAVDRVIPDCVRAVVDDRSIEIRNPNATRPYQHVLEPLFVYLSLMMQQILCPDIAGYYNVGPDDEDCVTTGHLADLFVKYWGPSARWERNSEADAPHEAHFLKLDSTRIKNTIGWHPVWNIDEAVQKSVEWYRSWVQNEDVIRRTEEQIHYFVEGLKCG